MQRNQNRAMPDNTRSFLVRAYTHGYVFRVELHLRRTRMYARGERIPVRYPRQRRNGNPYEALLANHLQQVWRDTLSPALHQQGMP